LLIGHHFISTLLSGRPHYAGHSFRHLLPLGFFDYKLFFSLFGKPVVLEFAIAVGGSFPFGNNPSLPLQPVECGIERAVLHLQEVVRGSLDVLSNLVTVSRTVKECSQDEHVKRALEDGRALLCLFRDGRHPTLDMAMMVDIRLPLVKDVIFRQSNDDSRAYCVSRLIPLNPIRDNARNREAPREFKTSRLTETGKRRTLT
jgi:hypothetical protein